MERAVSNSPPLSKEEWATIPFPPLREDLKLFPAAVNADGSPAWMIQDPISNTFYRIGWLEFELLSRWSFAIPEEILDSTAAETLLAPTTEELAQLHAFLLHNQLLEIHDVAHHQELVTRWRKIHNNRLNWLLHHYLFFRIPLLHPATLLARLLPYFQWAFSPLTAVIVISLTLIGLLLTARQWDSFAASFIDTLSPSGLGGYFIALAVTKSLHEFGHALTATRYGLRVAHMGIALVVLWPMLYTDTGEAWRLSNPRQRLGIAAAGIITEMVIAGLATLAWNLTNDGDLKQAWFFLATTSWLVSLGLNLSPFMRFDGYFILLDWLDMPNLHERSFALTRVVLRNALFGFTDPDPECLSRGRRQFLIAFAIITWLYRLIVFVAIAVAVYLYFFKLLGIFLFAVELLWFVLLPIWREIKIWHQRRTEIRIWRKGLLVLFISALLLFAALPWNTQVRGLGYAHPAKTHRFYSPLPAQLLEINFSLNRAIAPEETGELTQFVSVKAGQPLFILSAPELAYRTALANASVIALDRQLRGLRGWDEGEEQRARLQRQQALHRAEIQAQNDESQRLVLTAPFDGVLTDIDPELTHGVWVNSKDALAVLIAPKRWQVELFVDQADLTRLVHGARARFYPENQKLTPMTGTVIDIAATRTLNLPENLLSSQHGGAIVTLPNTQQLTPRDALYRVRIELNEMPVELRMLRGAGVIEGQPESWLWNQLKPALIVLIRELSF
jgi:putative peptide zinc metalloprotease protein